MKKDQLEEFVRSNRDAFNDLEPSRDIWAEIEKENTQKYRFNLKSVMWRAAAVALIFSASFMVNEFWHQQRNSPTLAESGEKPVMEINIPELLEAEVYYSAKVEERMKEFKAFNVNDPDVEDELQVEMEQLDIAFEELKEDLKDDIDNEEIVEAMIQNYRIKVRMLEEIISQLKVQQNKTEDEKIEYEI